jgi:elongation factor Tu
VGAGTLQLKEDAKMAMPGDNLTVSVELMTPLALKAGLRFALREGGRTVGAGVISRVLD